MLDQTSAVTPRPFSDRARRRALAGLAAPPRRRRGARRRSRANARPRPRRLLRLVGAAAALALADLFSASELARDGGTATAAASATATPTAPGAAAEATVIQAGEPDVGPASLAAAELVGRLAAARALARRTSAPVTLVLDPATGRLWIVAGSDVDATPASDGILHLDRVTLASPASRPAFTFGPDGVDGDSVWVRDGREKLLVVADRRSGEPRVLPR